MELDNLPTNENDSDEYYGLPRPLPGENPRVIFSNESFATLDWPKALLELSELAFHYPTYQRARLRFIDTIDKSDFVQTPLSANDASHHQNEGIFSVPFELKDCFPKMDHLRFEYVRPLGGSRGRIQFTGLAQNDGTIFNIKTILRYGSERNGGRLEEVTHQRLLSKNENEFEHRYVLTRQESEARGMCSNIIKIPIASSHKDRYYILRISAHQNELNPNNPQYYVDGMVQKNEVHNFPATELQTHLTDPDMQKVFGSRLPSQLCIDNMKIAARMMSLPMR